MEVHISEVIAQIQTSSGRFETWAGFSYSSPGSFLLCCVDLGPAFQTHWKRCGYWLGFFSIRGRDGLLMSPSDGRQSVNVSITDG